MDDYFSGLIRPHIDEMKLEEQQESLYKSKDDCKVEDSVITSSVVDIERDDETTSTDSSVAANKSQSSTSSTSSTSNTQVSLMDYQYPTFSYDRDYSTQLLAAVIGREFDEPNLIALKLQKLSNQSHVIKFIPYTVRRSVLVKGNFDWQEIKQFDVICLCYNASEARILLMGTDGFYTQLIKQLEASLGSNKIAFIITHHFTNDDIDELIATELKTRLSVQDGLQKYLQFNQVLSWHHEPCNVHLNKLIEIAKSECNPENFCLLL